MVAFIQGWSRTGWLAGVAVLFCLLCGQVMAQNTAPDDQPLFGELPGATTTNTPESPGSPGVPAAPDAVGGPATRLPADTIPVPPSAQSTGEWYDSLGYVVNRVWRFPLFRSGDATVELNQIILAGLIAGIGIWLSRRVTRMVSARLLSTRRVEATAAAVIHKVLFYALTVVITLVAMQFVGIPITVFTVLGGAVAIGLGFGAQNLFNNFISGLILLIERPIRIGDMVEVEGEIGRVEEIGGRCTRINRFDGIAVLVPNSIFLENTLINWTLKDRKIRSSVKVGVAYGSPTKKVHELIAKAVNDHADVHKEPAPLVLFDDFGDSALTFEAFFWTEVTTPMDLRRIASEVRFEIDDLFREADIVIAFPQQDVHLDTTHPLEVRVRQGEG